MLGKLGLALALVLGSSAARATSHVLCGDTSPTALNNEATVQDAHYTHAMATHPRLTGSGLAVLSLPLHLVLPAEASVLLSALTLALVAGVYLGFAFVDGRLSVMVIELVVALAFTGAALAAAMSWPAWAVIAFAAHGLWDWAHHRERVPTRMPRWYVPFCAVYDWVYAAALLGIWWMEEVLT